jgi:hypothetical protein
MRCAVVMIVAALVAGDVRAQMANGCDPAWQKTLEQQALEGMKSSIGRAWSTGLRQSESVMELSCFISLMDNVRGVNSAADPAAIFAAIFRKLCSVLENKVRQVTNFDTSLFFNQVPTIPGVVISEGEQVIPGGVGGGVTVTIPSQPRPQTPAPATLPNSGWLKGIIQ